MAQSHLTPESASLEDAVTTLFCLVDDAYQHINPRAYHYASLKKDSRIRRS